MNIYKMLLQVPYDWPTHKSIQEFRTRRLDVSTVALLKELIKPEYQEYASTIYKYRDTEPYKSIINFTLMRLLLTSYGIQVTDTHVNSDICTFNYITCPLKNRSDYHIVSDHIHTYTSSADVVIPYDTIRFGNNELLIDSIAKLINKPLLETESSLVHDAVKKYTSSQSITMLRNPKQYYLDIKKSCSLFMK